MTPVRRHLVTDPIGLATEVRAVQDALRGGVLQLAASAPARQLGAIACIADGMFTLRTASLRPARPEIEVAHGPAESLAAEVTCVLDGSAAADPAPSPSPATSTPPDPLLAEDALLLADLVRGGDPERLRAGLALTGCSGTPRWLRDLAFGARLRLTACLVDGSGPQTLIDTVMTEQGWGELDLHRGVIRFTPLSLADVRDRLHRACGRFARSAHPHEEAC